MNKGGNKTFTSEEQDKIGEIVFSVLPEQVGGESGEEITKATDNFSGKLTCITSDNHIQTEINKIKEKITSNHYLDDVFKVTEKLEIEVKEESKILKGHFPGTPLTPGVILTKLYETITGIRLDLGDKTISFDGMVIPGHKVVVQADGVFLNGKKVLSIKDTEYNIPFINQIPNGPKIITEINPNSFLLQSNPIDLALSSKIEHDSNGRLTKGDSITGEINTKLLDNNGKPDKHFLTEGVAQVLSSGVSFMLNGGENKDTKGGDFEMMTFSTLSSKTYELPENIGDKIFVEAITTKVEKREINAEYIIKDSNGNTLQTGIISGTPIKKKILDKSINKLSTEVNKEKLIEKIEKLFEIDIYGLSELFELDAENGKINVIKRPHHILEAKYEEENCILGLKDKVVTNVNNKLLKVLVIYIYSIDMGLLNGIEPQFQIPEGSDLEIRTNGLYLDGKPIFEEPKEGWIYRNFN